jgi:NADPH:quinone reductase-like Zn-dependent oxidoreductase
VQLAAARGAIVIATALPDDQAWTRGLGAREVVDYSADVAAAVREVHPEGVDSMIAAVHLGDDFDSVAGLVKDGGWIATTVGGADADALGQRGIEVTDVFGQSDPGPLRAWSRWPPTAASWCRSARPSASTSYRRRSDWSAPAARAASSP